jgi:hypothetical protein
MNKSTAILKWLLLAGAVYFLAIAIVHMLFVYYDLPSYGYQDRIISFLSFGWSGRYPDVEKLDSGFIEIEAAHRKEIN